MRVLKWTPFFSVELKSSIVLIWPWLPNLLVHLFGKGPLFSIAKRVGEPLKLNVSITMLSRPSVARICVEVDLLHELPNRVWIRNGTIGFW